MVPNWLRLPYPQKNIISVDLENVWARHGTTREKKKELRATILAETTKLLRATYFSYPLILRLGFPHDGQPIFSACACNSAQKSGWATSARA